MKKNTLFQTLTKRCVCSRRFQWWQRCLERRSKEGDLAGNSGDSPRWRMVKRCAEMSRKLRFFKDQIHKAGLPLSPSPTSQPDIELEELEVQLAEHEHELIEMNANSEKLQKSYNELLEFKMVLQKAGEFLVSSQSNTSAQETELDENVHSHDEYADSASLMEQEMRSDLPNQSHVRFISGVICKSKVLTFERMSFRATRGNMLFNQAPAEYEIMDPASNEMVEKVVFIVFFSGEQARTKILKICEAFGASCYPVPEDIIKRRQIIQEVCHKMIATVLTVTLKEKFNDIHSYHGALLSRGAPGPPCRLGD
nr:V-type proton ATPase subunit A1-like [Ipomoea batatas]